MLKEKIEEDFQKALKEKNEEEVSILRVLRAEIINREKEKRYRKSKENPELSFEGLEKESRLTDEELVSLIASEIKKRKEAVLEFKKGKREDLVEKEKKEIEILKRYLPEQLSEEEIRKLVKETVQKVGAKSLKDMGKVMREIMPKVKGRAEGEIVSKIVREELSSL